MTTIPVVNGPLELAVKLCETNVVFLATEIPVPEAEAPRVVVNSVAETDVSVVLLETISTLSVVVVAASVDEEPMVVVTMAGAVVLIVTVEVAVPEAEDEPEEDEPDAAPPVREKGP